MIDSCTGCRHKDLGLASRHKLALGGDRLSGAGVREREHPEHGQFSRRHRSSFVDLFNLTCFGPDKHNSRVFVHMGGS